MDKGILKRDSIPRNGRKRNARLTTRAQNKGSKGREIKKVRLVPHPDN